MISNNSNNSSGMMHIRSLAVHEHTATVAVWEHPNSTVLPIHFAQGNGFVAGVYRQMIEPLAQQHTVYATHHRASWASVHPHQPPSRFSWASAADDLIASLDALNRERATHSADTASTQKFIGVGHSLGGVMTLIAAHRRPDLFEKIVLIEPVMFPNRAIWTLNAIPMALRYRLLPMAKRTLNRRDVWGSHQEFMDYHARKSAFYGIPPSVMQDYAHYGLRARERQDGLELSFPKTWEAHIFRTISNGWQALKELKVPCVAIRGADSQWIPQRSWDKWQRMRPDVPVLVMPEVGHMAPLQQPQEMAQWVLRCIER